MPAPDHGRFVVFEKSFAVNEEIIEIQSIGPLQGGLIFLIARRKVCQIRVKIWERDYYISPTIRPMS